MKIKRGSLDNSGTISAGLKATSTGKTRLRIFRDGHIEHSFCCEDHDKFNPLSKIASWSESSGSSGSMLSNFIVKRGLTRSSHASVMERQLKTKAEELSSCELGVKVTVSQAQIEIGYNINCYGTVRTLNNWRPLRWEGQVRRKAS